MRKTTLIALATGALWAAGCQKTDVLPETQPSAISSSDVQNCDRISFNNAAVGAYLTSVNSDGGVPVAIASYNPHHLDKPVSARVFQSSGTISSWEDYDLGSPNNGSGGIGISTDGSGGSNTTALGNILVIQNFDWFAPTLANPEPNDEDFNVPLDSPNAASLTFTFPTPVTATSLTVIDVEVANPVEAEWGSIKLYDAANNQIGSTIYMPNTGDNGVAIVSLGSTPNVSKVVVALGGSIGIDNLAFCMPRSQCTYTQGYWKNHSWPASVNGMTIGGIDYTNAQLMTILNSPVQGNGYVSLMYQLIAARLNIANGSSSAAITQALADADALMTGKNLTGARNTWPTVNASVTSPTATTLDNYNRGLIGPGHCN